MTGFEIIRCGHEGCDANWRSADGITNVGSVEVPIWRCIDHREPVDHSSHRLDLRLAVDRAIAAAVKAEWVHLLEMVNDGITIQALAAYIVALMNASTVHIPPTTDRME